LLLWPLVYAAGRYTERDFTLKRQWLSDIASKTVVINKPKTVAPPMPTTPVT
jgi:hypothetical protein